MMGKKLIKQSTAVLVALIIITSVLVCALADTVTDISLSLGVTLWNKTGNAGELTYACIQFPSGSLPDTIQYGILDNSAYKYIGDYIEFCGKSINQINAETNIQSYTFSTFPSNADAKYRLPVIVFQNGSTIEVKVHNQYLASLGTAPISITVKKGLNLTNGTKKYSVESDAAFNYQNGSWISTAAPAETDISDSIYLNGWNTTGGASELKYTVLGFPAGALPLGIDYGIIDREQYMYIQDYIAINGKTVRQINSDTDTSLYSFSTFPSNADAKYRLPVIIFQNGNTLELKIHSRYIASLSTPLNISVLNGFSVKNGNNLAKVSETVTFNLNGSVWEKSAKAGDLKPLISVNGFNTAGDASELKYSVISFTGGVLPTDIGYGVIDRDNYKYIGDYIAVNGMSVNEINKSTDTSGYVFSTFPSTADDKYKLPVIVFQNGNTLEVKIHKSYIDALIEPLKGTENPVINISLLKGFALTSGKKQYVLSENVDYEAYRYVEPTDIFAGTSIDGFNKTGDRSELRYSVISFQKDVLPQDIGYGIIDRDNYKYIGDYIAVNGLTVNEINKNTDTSGYGFYTFPSSADDKYKLPVIVFQNGDTLEVKIHEKYIAALTENSGVGITVSLLKGLHFNAGGKELLLKKDIDYVAYKNNPPKNISSKIKIDGFITAGDKSELKYSVITFAAGILPNDLGYGVIDNENYKYIGDYITVNGKTVNSINKTTNVNGYDFASFPSTADVKYKLPVIVMQNGNTLEVKIHKQYVDTALKGKDITVGVKAGLTFAFPDSTYKTFTDISATVYKYIKTTEKDLGTVSVNGWQTNGDKGEYKSAFLNFEPGRLTAGINYRIIDDPQYRYLQDFIFINGKSVSSINKSISTSGYTFASFPANEMDYFRIPVIIYASGDILEVRMHSQYLQSIGGSVKITVKRGFYLQNGNILYTLNRDCSFTNINGVWQGLGKTVDIYDGITVFGWTAEGETTHSAYIDFGDYPVLKNNPDDPYSFGKSLLDFITVNGKTAKEINDTVSVAGYKWDTFPSTDIDSYKCPVILYANPDSNILQVRIHNKYCETLKGLKIGINTGFTVERKSSDGIVYYTLSKPVVFEKSGDNWGNINRKYVITYYLNGEKYGKEQFCSFMDKISLIEPPACEKGYVFSGWKTGTDIKSGITHDVKIYGYVLPERYKIEYELNGGKNSPQNPIFYNVESGEIKFEDARRGNLKFAGWYKDKNFKTKVSTLPAGSTGNIKLYARFEGKAAPVISLAAIADSAVLTVAIAVLAILSVLLCLAFIKTKKSN